ncbi:MAG: DUF2071 domain-containing protein [Rhodopirellula sp. JB053]
MPKTPWVMRMTWSELLFAHWALDPDVVRRWLPEGLQLDTRDGKAWVGVVPFLMSKVAPRSCPPLPKLSRFLELNVRTYVSVNGKPGVWFFSLDAESLFAVRAARATFFLPYLDAVMSMQRSISGEIQYESREGRYSEAIDEFDPVIQSGRDATLLPFALYGKGWAQMSLGEHDDAVKTLSLTIEKFPEHAIRDDALLARGISHRSLEDFDNAAIDLTQFLDTDPSGILRGHGLYELALVRQNQNRPEQAAERLAELVHDVPDYPGMDKVVYELGWSLKEAGQEDQAIEQFELLIETYPDNPMVNEAAYFVGQKRYNDENWDAAAQAFEIAAQSGDASSDEYNELLEKSLYRLGWSYFKAGNYPAAEAAFVRQFREASSGPLYLDAMMMVGEARFKQQKFDTALRAYGKAREKIEADNDTAQSIRDDAERQVRELTFLHGGQSAAQLKDWDTAINWYDELRKRFPATTYLPQVFYETGFAHQQAGNEPQALKLYGQVANNYRNELAARARFMMGEIHFANKSYSDAIPEFQRVMYGFGAEKADPSIKNWQAKSGFEAGRCAESLFDVAKTESAKEKARGYAVRFYEYVVNKHPGHELAAQSRDRLAALKG